MTENGSPDSRHVAGTLNDFLKASQDDDGKALNGLDFPLTFEYELTLPFASDKVAWHQAHGKPWCKDDCPTSSIRWALCATTGAYHKSHCDCHGHGTYISPDSGIKIWFIGVPKRKLVSNQPLDSRLYDDFANINLFVQDYSLEKTNTENWDWEVVILKPGMRLLVHFIGIYFRIFLTQHLQCHEAKHSSCGVHSRAFCLHGRAFLCHFHSS